MAFDKKNLEDYVDVAERIQQFYSKHENGRLVTTQVVPMEIAGKPFIAAEAKAYREPGDPLPGVGWAWEPVPGMTPYTKNSELMNAETSAWGRAIVSLGIEARNIASREEVRNRQEEAEQAPSSSAPKRRNGLQAPEPESDWHGQVADQLKAWGLKPSEIPALKAINERTGATKLSALLDTWLEENPGDKPFDRLMTLAQPIAKAKEQAS